MLVAATLLTLITVAQAPDTAPNPPQGTVTIDGSRTPERIPEWILWREVFTSLSDPDNPYTNAVLRGLALAPDQERLIRQAAARIAHTDALTSTAKRAKLAEMQAAGFDWNTRGGYREMRKALFDIEYPWRLQILEERDTLWRTLTPEARSVFEPWAEARRAGLTLLWPETEVASYQVPS